MHYREQIPYPQYSLCSNEEQKQQVRQIQKEYLGRFVAQLVMRTALPLILALGASLLSTMSVNSTEIQVVTVAMKVIALMNIAPGLFFMIGAIGEYYQRQIGGGHCRPNPKI